MHAFNQRGRRDRAEHGVAAIEFALVLPLLLLFVAGITDFGRAFFTEIMLTNAAREGARAAIGSSTATVGDVQARAAAAGQGVAGLNTTAVLCAGPGSQATVTTRGTFEWILLGPAMSLVGGSGTLPTTLSSTAAMQCY